MKAEDFISQALGKPWVNRATGPSSYDCWGLVVASFKHIDGIELPKIGGYESNASTDLAATEAISLGKFPIISKPRHGAIACYYKRNGAFAHVGRVLFGQVFHSRQENGIGTGQAMLDKISTLERAFYKVEYRIYASNSTI